MNYIKDVPLKLGSNYNMIIEIPKHTNSKFELIEPSFDKINEVRKVKGKYPFYYGCFPQTYAGDKDPLDAILLTNKKDFKSLDVVKVIPYAVIKTIDNNEVDDKVVCIIENEPLSNIKKLVVKMLNFLHTYKGKHSNMIIDNTIYTNDVAKSIIDSANKEYSLLNLIENKLMNF